MEQYRRPGHYYTKPENNLNDAESILWSLFCDIEYYLQEVNSKTIVPTKHALDMMLKHIHREIYDSRELVLATIKADEKREAEEQMKRS